ncbi:MAG: DUF6544 family protein [Sandaracinaceae bacterium]
MYLSAWRNPLSARPEVVSQFALRSRAEGRPGRILIEQRGTMRMKPDGRWLPFSAEEWFSESELAFCWYARLRALPLVTVVVKDAYQDGHGRLDAKVWGAIPVAHDEGPKVDHGQVQRYLAELPWNPRALLANPDLRFGPGPGGAVRVWVGEPSCYVDLHFDERGDIVRTYTETRHRGQEGATPWEGHFSDYGVWGGVRCPARGHVSWILPGGRFTYWRGKVTSVRREHCDGELV